MYKLSVPIMNHTAKGEAREEFVRQFKECGVDRVFIALGRDEGILKDNVNFFKSHGFEVAVWVGQTLGHGGSLAVPRVSEDGKHFEMMKGTNGTMRGGTACPLDNGFVDWFCARVKGLALTGVDTIMLDDDFRLSQHGGGFCCVCDMHMQKMSELCSEELKSEDVMTKVFSGKPNKYRDAWIKAQGDSLYDLAKRLRAAVDEVDPNIRIALCTAHSVWNIDGVDTLKLTRILAGNNTPLLRLHPAPYWGVKIMPLPSVFETARMLVSFVDDKTFELMPEGDVYPRPRYSTPASYLELFDAVLRADGMYGNGFKYMFDYNSDPTYETGYVKHHIHYLEAQNAVSKMFDGGKCVGVRIHERPNMLATSDFSLSAPKDRSPYPWGGVLMARCGVPTTYEGEGICDAVFGENARYFDLANAKNGVIIDAVAATILTELGFDVGLANLSGFSVCNVAHEFFGVGKVKVNPEGVRFINADISGKANLLSYVLVNGENKPVAYTYENADGVKLLVYTFDASALDEHSEMLCTYARANQIKDTIENFFGQKLPVKYENSPNLYTLCKEHEDGLSVILANCFADIVLEPTIELDKCYSEAEFVNCEGSLEGNILKLNAPINAFTFVAVKLKK